jgi:hypothetical protein
MSATPKRSLTPTRIFLLPAEQVERLADAA